jgi:hypothetical protein
MPKARFDQLLYFAKGGSQAAQLTDQSAFATK